MDSDNEAGFEVGRRHASSSSRESSPAARRQQRSFTPTSDDGELVIPPVPDADSETPPPENAPLIRQAVGFSWTPSSNANVSTYQATLPPKPAVPYFLPGQAPPPPPKPPKVSKPRAPRKKKNQEYSSQTGRFRLTAAEPSTTSQSPAPAPFTNPASLSPFLGMGQTASPSVVSGGNTPASTGTTSSTAATQTFAFSPTMTPLATSSFGYAPGNATAGPSNTNTAAIGASSGAAPRNGRQSKNPTGRKRNAPANGSSSQSVARQPATTTNVVPVTPQHRHNDNQAGSSTQAGSHTQMTYSPSPSVVSVNAPSVQTNSSTPGTQAPQNPNRPLRMVTLLIEDTRSGVPDSQLAEVKVPLRVADDPEDGFWADALDICNSLQEGPSRIDGPAKVFTMRGKFRQFFMRIDQFDQYQVQSAHLGVSKERTLNVFVEAPVPQGQLPRPPVLPQEARPAYNSGSDSETLTSPPARRPPTYSLVTREEQIERLSRSNYARPDKHRLSPGSDSGSYGHSSHTRRKSRPAHAGSSQQPPTPPIPGRLADTKEEQDEAIVSYIRSRVENHPGWVDYMRSTARPQRVSEVLKQYEFVEDRVSELCGLHTPPHWDGAPNCSVEREHVWRVLKLDSEWGERCRETLKLVKNYGKHGVRYEDSRVVDMINDTAPPKPKAAERFLRFLREVDEEFTRDMLSRPTAVAIPVEDSEEDSD